MTRTLIVIAAFLSLATTAALAAPPADKGKPESPGKSAAAPGHNKAAAPGQSSEQNSAKQCKAERASIGVDAFAAKYGTNPNKANAFGKCVSSKSKSKAKTEDDENEASESKAEESAAKKCKAERTSLGVDAFKAKYGTNANKANAFGKCVSKLAKAKSSS
jgi:hypothetical protein